MNQSEKAFWVEETSDYGSLQAGMSLLVPKGCRGPWDGAEWVSGGV